VEMGGDVLGGVSSVGAVPGLVPAWCKGEWVWLLDRLSHCCHPGSPLPLCPGFCPLPCRLALQLTTLQKMVQQAGSLRSEASMSPVSSLRTSAAPSMTPSLPPTVPELHQFRPQQAQQQQQQQQGASGSGSGSGGGTSVGDPSGAFWGLTRAVDCFRCGGPGGQAGGQADVWAGWRAGQRHLLGQCRQGPAVSVGHPTQSATVLPPCTAAGRG
jgi:hypothetical protein